MLPSHMTWFVFTVEEPWVYSHDMNMRTSVPVLGFPCLIGDRIPHTHPVPLPNRKPRGILQTNHESRSTLRNQVASFGLALTHSKAPRPARVYLFVFAHIAGHVRGVILIPKNFRVPSCFAFRTVGKRGAKGL